MVLKEEKLETRTCDFKARTRHRLSTLQGLQRNITNWRQKGIVEVRGKNENEWETFRRNLT
jgi:hypothetical protein